MSEKNEKSRKELPKMNTYKDLKVRGIGLTDSGDILFIDFIYLLETKNMKGVEFTKFQMVGWPRNIKYLIGR